MIVKTAEQVFKAPRLDKDTAKLRGYQLIEEYFVDSSGWGTESEPALTPRSFLEKVRKFHIGQHAFITDAGQFQVYVGFFKRAKPESRKIANNTILHTLPDGRRAVRLHATDILIENANGTVELNTGGWNTPTTRRRMNQYLAGPWRICSHKFTPTAWNVDTKEKVEIVDGLTTVPGSLAV